jgi:hypothetical protein
MGILGLKRPQAPERAEMGRKNASKDVPDPEALKRAVEAEIDAFLARMGLSYAGVAIDAEGWRHFTKGSARGKAGVMLLGDELFLHAGSPIMELPSDRELILPLMRELLERNCVLPYSARYGIVGGGVWVTCSRRVTEICLEEVGLNISQVMTLADNADDDLRPKYGGTTKKRSAG